MLSCDLISFGWRVWSCWRRWRLDWNCIFYHRRWLNMGHCPHTTHNGLLWFTMGADWGNMAAYWYCTGGIVCSIYPKTGESALISVYCRTDIFVSICTGERHHGRRTVSAAGTARVLAASGQNFLQSFVKFVNCTNVILTTRRFNSLNLLLMSQMMSSAPS